MMFVATCTDFEDGWARGTHGIEIGRHALLVSKPFKEWLANVRRALGLA